MGYGAGHHGDPSRAVSPAIGVVLMLAIVVLLAMTAGVMFLSFGDRLDEITSVTIYKEDRCAGDRVIEFNGDVQAFYDQISDNPCALWLDASRVDTDANDRVVRWVDRGPNEFHATQLNASRRPYAVSASNAPGGIGAPVVNFTGKNAFRSPYTFGHNSGDTSTGIRHYDNGDYLRIDRNVDQLGIDDDSGMVVAAVLYTRSFDRGGTWTIGEAGQAGREFSMRTCGADRTYGDCPTGTDDPTDHWRGQHWDVADVDFHAQDSHEEWIVLIHAYDGNETTIRVDGDVKATGTTDLEIGGNRDVQIGRWERIANNPDFYYDGAIAELLIFDRSMTDEELADLEAYFARRYGVIDIT